MLDFFMSWVIYWDYVKANFIIFCIQYLILIFIIDSVKRKSLGLVRTKKDIVNLMVEGVISFSLVVMIF